MDPVTAIGVIFVCVVLVWIICDVTDMLRYPPAKIRCIHFWRYRFWWVENGLDMKLCKHCFSKRHI